ncbi:MAG: hypothetical protein VW339_12945, partial [Quisquiliibacterium sp.]
GNQGNGYWVLYDADGVMLAYGDLIDTTNNGSLFDSVIRVQDSLEEGEEASYLVLGGYSSSQGFLIEEIAILTNDVETFGYEITDADGDTDTATLTISPDANDEPEAGSGSDALSSEDLVDAVETVLDAPDVSVTIESEPETNTAVIDVDWDNTDGAEQTITFDSLTEVQLRSALEEEPPTNP